MVISEGTNIPQILMYNPVLSFFSIKAVIQYTSFMKFSYSQLGTFISTESNIKSGIHDST